MRERITAAFVALALAVMVSAGLVRAVSLRNLIQEQEVAHLQHDADVTASFIDERVRSGIPVNRRFLAMVVNTSSRLSFNGIDGRDHVVTGSDYDGSNNPDDDLSASSEASTGGTVVVSESRKVVGALWTRDITSVISVLLLICIGAGLLGWWAARQLSQPFQKLAVAAADLGRGRFDLALPRSRIPEVQSISKALRAGATQLAGRVSREREFAEYASHQLRTPLTSLRLELEDLSLRGDVPDDARTSADRCLDLVERLDIAAGELVSMARQGALVEGAEVPLPLLATQITQRWSDRLGEGRRKVSASAEGVLTMTLTPGPVEQVLDLVLKDVSSGHGPVRLTFIGGDGFVRVKVAPGATTRPGDGVRAAKEVAEAQGGRITGDAGEHELELILPRR